MSPETNKVAGAVLGTLVFAMGIGFVADLIFAVEEPETPGFEVAVAEEGAAEVAAPADDVEPIAVRLATADAAAGEGAAKACVACHVLDSSNANKVGPGLWDIVGRVPGSHEGFNYSAALIEYGQTHVWDYEQLDAFLANPKAVVPGTKMAYAGLKRPEARADLIAFLRGLSDNPAPLPEVTAEEAADVVVPSTTPEATPPVVLETPAAETAPAPATEAAPAVEPAPVQ